MSSNISLFGHMPHSGDDVYECSLKNKNGLEVIIISYGAIIKAINIPDEHNNSNVVLNYNSLEAYLHDRYFVGAQIGPLANRISNSQFTAQGKTIKFVPNEGKHLLHGGARAFHNQNWIILDSGDQFIKLGIRIELATLEGTLPIHSTILFELEDDNQLNITMEAGCDLTFPINLTRHEYFNLRGKGSIKGHNLRIVADSYTPADNQLLPTGLIQSVENTSYDFQESRPVGPAIDSLAKDCIPDNGFDNNFIITKDRGVSGPVAQLADPNTSRTLSVFSSQPCLQFYTGQGFSSQSTHEAYSGLCLEAQGYPDAPNQKNFPDSLVDKEQSYNQIISYRFGWAI